MKYCFSARNSGAFACTAISRSLCLNHLDGAFLVVGLLGDWVSLVKCDLVNQTTGVKPGDIDQAFRHPVAATGFNAGFNLTTT